MFYDRLLKTLEAIKRAGGRGMGVSALRAAKLFLFEAEQAEVFLDNSYALDSYPHFAFDNIFINFTRPVVVPGGRFPYAGVHLHTETVLAVDPDSVTVRGDFLDPNFEVTGRTKGCAADWYPAISRRAGPSSVDCFTTFFTPDTFPGFGNENLYRGNGTFGHAELLHRLGVSLLYFLTCENVVLKRTASRGSKLFSLKSKGQRSAHPFYTVAFRRGAGSSSEAREGSGQAHGFRYDVSGHFRHLRDDRYARNSDGTYKVIWVRSHQRGLASNTYVPACRRVVARTGSEAGH